MLMPQHQLTCMKTIFTVLSHSLYLSLFYLLHPACLHLYIHHRFHLSASLLMAFMMMTTSGPHHAER